MNDKGAFLKDVRQFNRIASLGELWELFGCDYNLTGILSWIASAPDLLLIRGEDREIYVVSKKIIIRIFVEITKKMLRANTIFHKQEQHSGDRNFERKRIFTLEKVQLAQIFEGYRYRGKDDKQRVCWGLPLEELIRFGEKLGLITRIAFSNSYLFPLVFMLKKNDYRFCNFFLIELLDALYEVIEMDITQEVIALHELSKKNFSTGMGLLPDRDRGIIRYRAGLETGKKETLEAIGGKYGLTRERIRQVENRCLRKIRNLKVTVTPYFIKGLVFTLLARRGRLVFRRENLILDFLLDCFEITKSTPLDRDIGIIGYPKSSFEDLVGISKNGELFLWEKDEALKRINDFWGGILGKRDLFNIYKYLRKRCSLSKFKKVFLALKNIGHVAHFSEIAERYNLIFPDDITSEHAVHAVLTRSAPAIVWVGCRGMYALSEWGFERPDETLFETVARIVERIHSETGEWVTIVSVEAEIGKIRPLLNKNSLLIALTLNPRITAHRGKFFKPKGTNENENECDDDKEDDLIAARIREFQKSQNKDFS